MSAHIQVSFSLKWQVGVNPEAYAGRWTGAEPWIGELSCRPTFTREVMDANDDWRDAAKHAAAAFWESLGFRVGEAPRLDDTVEEYAPGRVRIKATALVTVPPYWTGAPETLGQGFLFEDIP